MIKSSFKAYSEYRQHLVSALERISDIQIEAVVDEIMRAHSAGRWIYVIGNGGSASTASHMACDLNKGASLGAKEPLRVTSLTDNMAHFSALGNDEGYENVFTGQLRNVIREGDVLIGISASGNSPNCVKAFELAQEKGATTIGLLGFEGGRMAERSNLKIVVQSNEYGPLEDVHLVINHVVTEILKTRLQES